jgi:hypothetical protein
LTNHRGDTGGAGDISDAAEEEWEEEEDND